MESEFLRVDEEDIDLLKTVLDTEKFESMMEPILDVFPVLPVY